MKIPKVKFIVTVISLFFFISSGILSTASSLNCGVDTCCQDDCCYKSMCLDNSLESSFIPGNNCCDISQGIPENCENLLVFISQTKLSSPLIINHSINTSQILTNKFHSRKDLNNSPLIYSLIPALRI